MQIDAEAFATEMGQQLAALIREQIEPMRRELETLRKSIGKIEERGILYRGVFQRAEDYRRGDVATYDGALWIANTATRSVPGNDGTWTLAAKAR